MRMELQPINKLEALRYSGWIGQKPDPSLLAVLEKCEERLLAVAAPQGLVQVCSLEHSPKGILLDQILLLQGKNIAEHLAGCNQAVLMAVTLGSRVDALLRELQLKEIGHAHLCDALASAAAEQLCDRLEILLKQKYPDKSFTERFSPGYGDLPIEVQGELLAFMKAPLKIGLCANQSSILTPRKSVTAVLGMY